MLIADLEKRTIIFLHSRHWIFSIEAVLKSIYIENTEKGKEREGERRRVYDRIYTSKYICVCVCGEEIEITYNVSLKITSLTLELSICYDPHENFELMPS